MLETWKFLCPLEVSLTVISLENLTVWSCLAPVMQAFQPNPTAIQPARSNEDRSKEDEALVHIDDDFDPDAEITSAQMGGPLQSPASVTKPKRKKPKVLNAPNPPTAHSSSPAATSPLTIAGLADSPFRASSSRLTAAPKKRKQTAIRTLPSKRAKRVESEEELSDAV
ncbi:Hypothetical predicted protein [Lecanosticta acicola]|uniref:Uncharacterized protein n=1 Tax=Lecanosticta acicola TaxID=111012 RepID=A0AAI8Z3P3_9PEZI|nr:Hypothetical predicted protein [Lecanosticta acicola]